MDTSLRVTPELLKKYDRPGPRYTSYPTAVEFHEAYNHDAYAQSLEDAAVRGNEPLSLYIHLPFCEERCSFCGCHVIITKKRDISAEYLTYLHREIRDVAKRLRGRRKVVQYHWGGGTPTYLAPQEMRELHAIVAENFEIQPGAEVAIEVDPRVTTHEQIDLLRELGWNRLSMGVQDFTPAVQEAINRHQTEAETRALYRYCREVGFTSINLDLIYGLPLQSLEAFTHSLDVTLELRPDRVALYSYAYVPWIKGNQKKLDVEQLPSPDEKMELFCLARDRFLQAGYTAVGMDHFALPEDELSTAIASRTLHRNFMGYTVKTAPDMIGVGVSAIGDVSGSYAQNAKKLSVYYQELDAGRLPVERGYRLSDDDLARRYVITQLMCNFYLDKRTVEQRFGLRFDEYFARELSELARPDGPVDHQFVRLGAREIEVLPMGRLFVRNVAMEFDRYLREKDGSKPVFSRTV